MTTANDAAEGRVRVDAVSFVRAESDTYFDSLLAAAGGLARWHHIREPAPVDKQLVVRMNRDTLYSSVIVDLSEGAELTMPDAGGRYQTAMVVDQDHYIDKVFDRPGLHRLERDEFGTPWVAIAVRTLVDPGDRADLMAVTALQDRLAVTARSAKAFTHPAWDAQSLLARRFGPAPARTRLGYVDLKAGEMTSAEARWRSVAGPARQLARVPSTRLRGCRGQPGAVDLPARLAGR